MRVGFICLVVTLTMLVHVPTASAQNGRTIAQTVIGEIVPRQGGEIAAAIAAPVEAVMAVAGDRVRAGSELARLNVDDRRADLEIARKQVTVAQAELRVREAALDLELANLRRLDGLRGSVAFNAGRFDDSQKEVLRLRAEIAVGRVKIEEAQARADRLLVDIARARILAPYGAVVTSREVDLGDYVTPGRRMFTLVSTRNLEIEADVPVKAIAGLRQGTVLEAQTRDGRPLRVKVRALIPVENPLTRTRSVRFSIEDSVSLAIGQPIELNLPISPDG